MDAKHTLEVPTSQYIMGHRDEPYPARRFFFLIHALNQHSVVKGPEFYRSYSIKHLNFKNILS